MDLIYVTLNFSLSTYRWIFEIINNFFLNDFSYITSYVLGWDGEEILYDANRKSAILVWGRETLSCQQWL